MKIILNALLPLPLSDFSGLSSEVWKHEEVVFETGGKYLIKAPSGKGKTTLLSVLYGLRKDYMGNVAFDERNISNIRHDAWTEIRKSVFSIVFQDFRLFPELTALENLLVKNKLTAYRSEKEIMMMAEEIGVHDLFNTKLAHISVGQQQRIALLRALCQPFRMILLDEPFSHLDRENEKKAFGLVEEVCKQQGAGMMITALEEPINNKTLNILNL